MDRTNNQKVLAYLREHQDDMVALLTHVVELESPSDHKPSLDKLSAFLAGESGELGAVVEILEQPEAGNHVRARWGRGEGGALILCHMDTVWNLGTITERPVRIEDGKLYGPGADDMKGGIVIALWAIRALRELGMLPEKRITMLLNTDEEVGSPTSQLIIEREAREHDVVFVLEPPVPPHGSLKTWRKGVGGYRISTSGWATHAGADHEKGVNAIDELAHQILAVQGFTNYETGTTFNVGVVGGGTRSNVIPAEAWAEIDVRVKTMEEFERVKEKMQSLKVHNPKATLKVTGGMNRPPMVRTADIVALFVKAQSLASEMGLQISEAGTGGGSDGNFTAALGIPTLDGMGADGDGGHALDEYVLISSLPERAAILAAMLRSM
ncbi:MAG: M20 family metallopeptidase [Anaerolineaceae bacterium]|nr:M20 family metallopeptidase [Anaerolineaceae bacterium]